MSAGRHFLQVVCYYRSFARDPPEKVTALVEKMASRGSVTRQQLREAAANPKAGRPEALRLRLSAHDQSLQVSRRAAPRARSHPP